MHIYTTYVVLLNAQSVPGNNFQKNKITSYQVRHIFFFVGPASGSVEETWAHMGNPRRSTIYRPLQGQGVAPAM